MRKSGLELLLALAVRRDVTGDIHGALRLGLLLVEESKEGKTDFRTRVLVRTAVFYDHVGNPERGLSLLQPTIRNVSAGDAAVEVWWPLIQYGTLLAKAGRNHEARDLLRKLRKTAPRQEHRTAALHQLAVIDLKEAGESDQA